MSGPEMIRCPVCQEADACDHDQAERKQLCRVMSVAEELELPARATSDAGEQGRRRRQKASERESAVADLRWVMGDPRGRRFVGRLLARCGLDLPSFTPALPDAAITAFREGARNVGLGLQADLRQHARADFLKLFEEDAHVVA